MNSIQVGLRIPEERNAYLEAKADKLGVNKNALICMLIELGLQVLNKNTTPDFLQ